MKELSSCECGNHNEKACLLYVGVMSFFSFFWLPFGFLVHMFLFKRSFLEEGDRKREEIKREIEREKFF